jgi:hypothetical protein
MSKPSYVNWPGEAYTYREHELTVFEESYLEKGISDFDKVSKFLFNEQPTSSQDITLQHRIQKYFDDEGAKFQDDSIYIFDLGQFRAEIDTIYRRNQDIDETLHKKLEEIRNILYKQTDSHSRDSPLDVLALLDDVLWRNIVGYPKNTPKTVSQKHENKDLQENSKNTPKTVSKKRANSSESEEDSSEEDSSEEESEDDNTLPVEKTVQLRQQLTLLCKADKEKYKFVRYISIKNLKKYNLETGYAARYGSNMSRMDPVFYKKYLKSMWKKDIFLYYMYAYYLSLHEARDISIWCDEDRNLQNKEVEKNGFIDIS